MKKVGVLLVLFLVLPAWGQKTAEPAPHSVEVTKDGYSPETKTVTVNNSFEAATTLWRATVLMTMSPAAVVPADGLTTARRAAALAPPYCWHSPRP